ncbi:MAG: RNase J family beta-CASP ribonuclease [Oscillospiraceae bacterium]|nr:RNase J family beta-CASP ribonuclease [Oscillospiraceae bacterium]
MTEKKLNMDSADRQGEKNQKAEMPQGKHPGLYQKITPPKSAAQKQEQAHPAARQNRRSGTKKNAGEKKNAAPHRPARQPAQSKQQGTESQQKADSTQQAGTKAQPKAQPKAQKGSRQKSGEKPRGGRRKNASKEPMTAIQKTVQKYLTEQDAREKKEAAAQKSKRGRRGRKGPKKPSIRAYFLGGLNEVGKNFTLYECENDMVIVDCGMAFPDGDMLGVDLVLPDFTFVERNAEHIRGIVLTHGHEDHIGALPYLLKKINVPIYGTPFTLALINSKLKEHGLQNSVKAVVIQPGEHAQLGCMDIEFIHVNHSVPDAVSVAIHSPAGVIVHTGDFKIDCTPAQGKMIDLGRFAQLGNEGVLALFSDSTNAEREGYTKSEKKVDSCFDMLFKRAQDNRIIIATFASNVSRVQQIINCAVKYGRKVALSGRSMVNVMTIGVELGYLDVPKGVLIDIDMINRYPKNKIVLVTTGSQGEPMSALTRMAFADHRKVEVGPDDCIIISARPIPGNEKTIGNVIDELMKRGCRVVYESMYEVHVSGHACQEELKLMQGIVKPKYFIPVHGEQKMLRKNAELSYSMGRDPKNVFIGDNGDVVELNEDYMKRLAPVPAGRVLVDGLGVGDVGSVVLRDRKHLAEDGLIVVVCTISCTDGHIISGPDVVSRGFVYVRESEPLIDEARDLVTSVLQECAEKRIHDWGTLKTRIKDELSRLLYSRTRRSPMVLPIIMEV